MPEKYSIEDFAKKINRFIHRIIKHEEFQIRTTILGYAITQWSYHPIFVRASELKMRAVSLLRI